MRRPIYIFCSMVSTAVWTLYFFTDGFWPMVLITTVYGIFYAPLISFLEAFTMDALAGERQSYGRYRVWGSISFILIVVAVGRIIDIRSIRIILVLIFAGSLIHAIGATRIPPVTANRRLEIRAGLSILVQRRVIVFLISAFLMLVSHGTYYGFFSIHLESLGYTGTSIGFAWALAATAEIVVMINAHRLFRRFAIETVLLASFGGAALRWLVLSTAVTLPVVLATQLLHAFTYGAFHVASILYVDSVIPENAKTLGQAANNAVTYGLGIMVGFLGNGYAYERLGAGQLFGISAVLAIAGGLVLAFGGRIGGRPQAAG
jgi:PPP family 3-phenylpropionic acid transporter